MCFVYPQTTPHVLLVFIKRRLKDLTIHVGLACIPFLRILCRWFLPDYYENNQWSVVSWELLPLFCIIWINYWKSFLLNEIYFLQPGYENDQNPRLLKILMANFFSKWIVFMIDSRWWIIFIQFIKMQMSHGTNQVTQHGWGSRRTRVAHRQ